MVHIIDLTRVYSAVKLIYFLILRHTHPVSDVYVVLGTLNTFDGTDPKVDKVKPKVRNKIFSPRG